MNAKVDEELVYLAFSDKIEQISKTIPILSGFLICREAAFARGDRSACAFQSAGFTDREDFAKVRLRQPRAV